MRLAVGFVVALTVATAPACSRSDTTTAPVELVQPFALTYERCDQHVIAFLGRGAPYRAVEAMIQRRPGHPPLVRVIVTRSDDSQVDYLNDRDAMARRADLLGRVTRFSPIDVVDVVHRGAHATRISLQVSEHEPAVLEVTAASSAVRQFGGLTDPRGHAKASSLPVMWRDASALTSSARVEIGGSPVPVRRIAIGLDACYTDGFRIGVVRTARRTTRVVHAPTSTEVGDDWVFDERGRRTVYRVTASHGRDVVIENRRDREVIHGRRLGDRIDIQSIGVGARSGEAGSVLRLSSGRRFSLSIDQHVDLVEGDLTEAHADDVDTWLLGPTTPPWAVGGVIVVRTTRAGPVLTSETTLQS